MSELALGTMMIGRWGTTDVAEAISAAIIGPRTYEQLDQLLTLGPLVLPTGVHARIDPVVAPGRNVNPADAG